MICHQYSRRRIGLRSADRRIIAILLRTWRGLCLFAALVCRCLDASGLAQEPPARPPGGLKLVDDVAEPATDSALDVGVFVAPIPWFRQAETGEITALHVHLGNLLAAGFKEGGSDLDKVRAAWSEAVQLCPDDPRVPYACGLVLAHQKKADEALKQFEAAARRSDPPFPPALQALAWVHLRRKNVDAAAPLLRKLAEAAESNSGHWPTDQAKEAIAIWLGTVAGYLTGPGQLELPAAAAGQIAMELKSCLTDRRRTFFEQGRGAFDKKYAALNARAVRPLDELGREHEAERQRLVDLIVELERQQAELDDTLRDVRKAKADASKETTDVMQGIQRRRTALQGNGKKASIMLQRLLARGPAKSGEREEVYYEEKKDKDTGKIEREEKTRTIHFSTAKDLQEYSDSVGNARSTLAAVEVGLKEVAVAAQKVKERREANAERFGADITDQQKTADQHRRKLMGLKEQLKSLNDHPPTREELQSEIRSLATYLPFDLAVEKTRLQASLKTPLPKWVR